MSPFTTALPSGSKLWLLDLGTIDLEAANSLAGANQFPVDLPPQPHERRNLIMIAALLVYPGVGLILFDTGSGENVIESWGERTLECSPRIWDKAIHGLPEAIKATGAGEISDVKVIILSHLHVDHAGGLEHFLDTDVEIWCHENELKNAFWTCATGIETSSYLKDYLVVDRLKWKTFSGQTFDIYQGITLHHTPGHTEGSISMEIELEHTGSVLMTGDLFHVKENYEQGIPQGTLMRDYNAWQRSRLYVRTLVQRKGAKVVLGHEPLYFYSLKVSPSCIE